MSALHYFWKEDTKGVKSLEFGFNPCARKPESWKNELYAAARQVYNQAQKPIWVCLSGGIGSEVACRAFYDQGISITALTLVHAGGTNTAAVEYAKTWCRERSIKHVIQTIDLEDFFGAYTDKMSARYPAYHPFRYLQIRLMEIVEAEGGYAVLGGGDQLYEIDPHTDVLTPQDVYLPFTTGTVAPYEWCKDTNTRHEPYFFYATPELYLAYMEHPLVQCALNNPEAVFRHPGNAYALKRLVYQSAFPHMQVRYKMDSFYHLRPLVMTAIDRIQKQNHDRLFKANIAVPRLQEELRGEW